MFEDDETPIGFNVGGQVFETTVGVITRDPYSLLAACCRKSPPFPRNEDGCYYFDRDWWLFRHILSYLRSNVLPSELETLKELYKEASYYRLESMLKSIENIPLSQIANLTSQIAVTWPGSDTLGKEQLSRTRDSYVYSGSLFKSLN